MTDRITKQQITGIPCGDQNVKRLLVYSDIRLPYIFPYGNSVFCKETNPHIIYSYILFLLFLSKVHCSKLKVL